MNLNQNILLVLILSVLASATDTNLATNQNFLLLLLLSLTNENGFNNGCNQNTCPGQCPGTIVF